MAKMEFTDFGQSSSNAFEGDFGNREHRLPGGGMLDASAFAQSSGEVLVKVNDADVNAGETSMTVDALPGAIPAGTVLEFSDGNFAKLSANAAAGATTLTVVALDADIADDATATYDPEPGFDLVAAGTLVGRTTAEKLAGDPLGPYSDSDNEIFIVAEDVDISSGDAGCELCRHGSLIKFNFLPSWTGASATAKTALHASYDVIKG
jgi:hypothetical protein